MKFSHTRIQTYLDCPRKYKHYYLNRVAMRKRPIYFVLGSAMHKFIEMFYRTQDVALAKRQVEQEFAKVDRTLLNREEVHDLEVAKNTALGMAAAYPKFYKQDFDEFDKFLTEQEFNFPFPKWHDAQTEEDRPTYGGFIDLLVKDHAGDWWQIETKTASAQTLTAGYFDRVKLDSQVMGYMHACKEILGVFPRGIIYNVIKKPSIRLKKGESLREFQQRVYHEYTKFATEKKYFTRTQVIVDRRRLKEWLKQTTTLANHIQDQVKNKSKFWPMNTGHCQGKFGSCQYMPACIARSYNKILYVKDKR